VNLTLFHMQELICPGPNIQMVESFGPDLPLLFKLHEIWSVDSQENP